MSRVVINYIESLPKEYIIKKKFAQVVDSKIRGIVRFGGFNFTDNLQIFKITDTLFYLERYFPNKIPQHFIETAYENMIIGVKMFFGFDGRIISSHTDIYKLIDGDIWNIYLSHHSNGETLVEFTVVGRRTFYDIENLIQSDTEAGEYVRLGGDYSDLTSFFKRLVSLSPIILPALFQNFEGKIEEAFNYPLQEGIVGIQFIDIDPETV